MFHLFANAATTAKALEAKESAEKSVKTLELRIDGLKQDIRDIKRDYEEEIEDLRVSLDRSEESREYEDRTRVARHLHDQRMSREEYESELETLERKIEELEAAKASAIKVAVAEGIALARVEIMKAVEEEVEGLHTAANEALVMSAAYEAEAREKDTVIEGLKSQIADYKEFVQFVLTKLPDVKMDKFNINVEMPAPEVTVVSAGDKGGQKKS